MLLGRVIVFGILKVVILLFFLNVAFFFVFVLFFV